MTKKSASDLDRLLDGKTGWESTAGTWSYDADGHSLEVRDIEGPGDRYLIQHNGRASRLGTISGVAVRLNAMGVVA